MNNILIPIISSLLFRLGGVGRDDRFLPFMKPPTPIAGKAWRWFMGVPIALWFFIKSVKFAGHEYDLECDFAPLFCILTYLIATNVINYGEGQIWRKWLGRDGCWLFYGFCFGLASFPVLGWWAILQAVIASYSFWFLMQLSSEGKLDHAYVEVGIGFMGTIMYLFA